MAGTLYVVATPIGNLSDITLRAIETLRSVDLIACEDTRHTRKLLEHFGIKKFLISYHEHNETERATELIKRLQKGESIALVSDAGTPAISDPGYRIVKLAIGSSIRVVPIPGPSAAVAALSATSLPTDSFFFGGFLPAKTGERRRRLGELASIPGTLAFYEAPHRILRTLADCLDVLGDRSAAVARELTKVHEEIVRGSLSKLISHFEEKSPKGELVLLIDRGSAQTLPKDAQTTLAERVAELESAGHEHRSALKQAAREFGLTRSEAYRELQNAKNS
ncbi:MAG TPA: 16S rRNA (cytidine(1402)-2'-O)-methyltransferase [Pyrinomonadaceae bacterium]|nr:16S rRNA (cytidine(1402)-2'-O)-methyltransferase [Pyrinomonadaceae bacterium]